MKGLRKVLTPFAPDQSGAVSVLYELGGILVICDAGGCVGNICGFDEPRWFRHKSAVFSAGLRDMDAIMGRDDMLVKKLVMAADQIKADFAAVIGTPVPAVIGTDYRALTRMAEKKSDLPVIAIEATGTFLYDKGEEKAWKALFKKFADKDAEKEKGRVGIIGMTPLSLSDLDAGEKMTKILKAEGYDKVSCYGMGSGLSEVRTAYVAEKNLVVSPAGMSVAKEMYEKAGIPYEVADPLAVSFMEDVLKEYDFTGKKVLVIDQQVSANSMRQVLRNKTSDCIVTVGNWFMELAELREDGDVSLKEEDQFTELVKAEGYDVIIGDRLLWDLIPDYKGMTLDKPHFALSGRLVEK